MKEDSLSSFIGQKQNPNYEPGDPKRLHFFEDKANETIAKLDLKAAYNTQRLEQELKNKQEYNKNLTTLNPKYASLQPNSLFILRCFVYTGQEYEMSSSLLIGPLGLPQVSIKTRNGQGEITRVTDPYAYRGKAVIVAVPSTETEYKPGDIVQINTPRTIAPIPGDQNFLIVENSYLHPDATLPEPPRDVTHEDFGYVITNRSQIILRLPQS